MRYDERGAREEEWLNLGRSRFSWLSEPAVGCASNPTVVQGLTPMGKDAVDHKVQHLKMTCFFHFISTQGMPIKCLSHRCWRFMWLLQRETPSHLMSSTRLLFTL